MDALAFRGHERKLRRRRVLHIQLSNSVRLAALASVAFRQKNIGPCSLAGRGDSPDFRFLPSPRHRGGWRATRRMAWITPDRPESAWLPDEPGSPGSGREASRPAPCGAPTRHLGLYAFDRGRTGPAPSGRRGCPSTARGRRLRKSFARRCRSRSPPTRRLMNAPLVEWIGMASA